LETSPAVPMTGGWKLENELHLNYTFFELGIILIIDNLYWWIQKHITIQLYWLDT
jgi:hypothetical protein